jgi:hypothetical protein
VKSEVREQRKEQYLAAKAEYTAATRRKKSKSWKEFCNLTSVTNPWNAVYKMAVGKTNNTTQITTMKLQDGSLTKNIQDTLLHMIQKFAPEDNQEEDTQTHSQIRMMAHKAPDMQNDEEFTLQEVTNVIQGMGSIKGPRRRWNPKRGVEMYRRNTAQVFNSNLQWLPKRRSFSEKVEESKGNTHSQTGQRRKR